MRKNIMAENVDIPENADKILFAEDLITFMMLRNARVDFRGTTDRYRNLIHNGFNESTRQAVRFLDNTMEMSHDDIFDFIKNANAVNHITYMRFAKDICTKYFPDGFDANHFLHYCVHLGSMAAYFYNHGVPEAPNLAVMYIVNAIQYFNMSTGGWDTLQRISQRYATMEFDSLNTLSPSSNDSEEDLEQYAVDIIPVLVVDEKKAEGEIMGDGSKHDVLVNKAENKAVGSNQNALGSDKDMKISSQNIERTDEFKEMKDLNERNASNKKDNVAQDLTKSSMCDGERTDIPSWENVDDQNGLLQGRKIMQTNPEAIDDKKVKYEEPEPSVLDHNQETKLINSKYSYFSTKDDGKFTELQKSMLAIKQYFEGNPKQMLNLYEQSGNHSKRSDENPLERNLDEEKAHASTSSSLSLSEVFQLNNSGTAKMSNDCDREISDCSARKNVIQDINGRNETLNNNTSEEGDCVESKADARQTECNECKPSTSGAAD